MNWKPVAILLAVTAMTTGLAVRTLWPKVVTVKSVPRIVTHYDTVHAVPKWYQDSVRVWKRRKYTTDTVNLVYSNTVVDTQYVPVNAPPEDRPDVWPLLSYHSSGKWGDSAVVSTYSLRSGNMAITKVFVPGILVDVDAFRDGNSAPKLNYVPFPPGEKHGFWHNPAVFGIGFGSCAAIGLAASLTH
jgi:hypothetical protein